MPTLKEKIYETLKSGAKSDRAVAALLGKPQASVRRARNELVAESKVTSAGKIGGEQCWTVGEAKTEYASADSEDDDNGACVEPAAVKKALKNTPESTPVGAKKDWRNTGFTF